MLRLAFNFEVDFEKAASEAGSATWNVGTNRSFASWPRKTTEILDRVHQSQDLSELLLKLM
jgi:hypothetical protein